MGFAGFAGTINFADSDGRDLISALSSCSVEKRGIDAFDLYDGIPLDQCPRGLLESIEFVFRPRYDRNGSRGQVFNGKEVDSSIKLYDSARCRKTLLYSVSTVVSF